MCQDDEKPDSDEDWKVGKDVDSDTDDEMYFEEENIKNIRAKSFSAHELAAVRMLFLFTDLWLQLEGLQIKLYQFCVLCRTQERGGSLDQKRLG